MNPQRRMLLWSEWRQRRAQFVVCLIWLLLGMLYTVAHEMAARFRAPVASFQATVMLYGMCAPIFLAMRTSLGELTERTKAMHDGMPVSPARRTLVRLAGGIGVLVIPILIAATILSLCLMTGLIEQAQERPLGEWLGQYRLPDRPSVDAAHAVAMTWKVVAIATCSSTLLYLFVSILGTAMQAESHLGFAGVALAAVYFLMSDLQPMLNSAGYPMVARWAVAIFPQSLAMNYGYGTEKGTYGDLVFANSIAVPLILNVVLQCALAAVFIRRYCRKLARSSADKADGVLRTVWRPWTIPLPTRSLAIAWLTLRQAMPMCIPGLILAFIMAPFQMEMADWTTQSSFAERVTDILPSSMWIVGLLWAVVVGSGIFSAELDRHVSEFWRAWPTSTLRLFAVKFAVGLAATLLVLDGSTIALSWNSPNWGQYHFMNWPYIAVIVPLHATMFAVAVAWTCVLRRPIIGGMAAFATFTLLMIGTDWSEAVRRFNPIEVYNELNAVGRLSTHGPLDFTRGYPMIAALMACVVVSCIVIGWRSLRGYVPSRSVA